MAIDLASVGRALPPLETAWTPTDCLLYALAVGAGTDDLQFTTENTEGVAQLALPTFAVIPGASYAREAVELAGTLDWTRAVDGGHELVLRRPVPVAGRVLSTRRVADLWDKGTAAIVVIESLSVDADSGEELFVNRTSMFFPGHGGFGGPRGPSLSADVRGRAPDHVVTHRTRDDQALLYRLTGDRYPIHSDPAYARAAGFDRPILHGLCTFAFAARALIASVAGSDAALLRSIAGGFTAPAFPGDELQTEIWEEDGEAAFRVRRTDATVVLDHGRAAFGPPEGGHLAGAGAQHVSGAGRA